MLLESKQLKYEWQDDWAGLNGIEGDSHHGMAIDSQGRIYCSFSIEPHVRVFNPEGDLLDAFNVSGTTMHCLFISKDAEGEWLWNIDLANKVVTKSSLTGEIIRSIGPAAFNLGEDEKFEITAGTVDPETGNVWIADGYGYAREGSWGGNKIYVFNPALELQFSFNGSEAPCGEFKEPHWIFADTRKGHTEIYITDRRHDRLVVYDGAGNFLREVGGDLHTPSAFGTFDDKLVVAELEGRVHILNADDEIIETLADGSEYAKAEGWPARIKDGSYVPPQSFLEQGKFNSPHGLAVDASGNIYVHEWIKGVRLTKLRHLPA